MGMIPMRFITGGCGRSYPFEAGIATFPDVHGDLCLQMRRFKGAASEGYADSV